MKLTIGIDIRTIYYPDSVARGIGHYALYHLMAIIDAMPDASFVLYSRTLEHNDQIKTLLNKPHVSLRLASDYHSADVDLMHICDPMNEIPGFESPFELFMHARMTATFYDLIPLHVYFAHWPAFRQQAYRSRLNQAVTSSCHFLAISEFTRKDLTTQLHIPVSRTTAIMAGLNKALPADSCELLPTIDQVKKKFGISKPFFFHVGSHVPHKNFNSAYQAFASCQQNFDIQLVVAGKMDDQMQANARHAAERGLSDVIFTGFVSRQELELLYREATGLLFLSCFEGFGFPVLEAMANGCPVITTNVTSIPEVAGNAALMFTPDDIGSIAAGMEMLLSNPMRRTELIEAGYRQAARFTWEKTAEKTIEVWHTMLRENLRSPESFQGTSPGKSMSVMLDISVLGLAQLDPSSRTGVFRVVEHLAQGLAACPDIDLHFCSTQHLSEHAPHTVSVCREYLATHVGFENIPFHETNYPKTDIFHSPFHPLPQQTNATVRFQSIYDLIPILFPHLFQGRYNPLPGIIAGIKPGDHALCISASTRNDLCRTTGMDRCNTHITYLAADPTIFYPCTDIPRLQAIRHKYNIGPAPYLLSLCTLEPRKNIDLVIRAFACLVRQGRAGDARLVLTGTRGWDVDRIFSEIDNNPELHSRIVLTGYVPDEDLAPLYSGATAFVYMSLYEGFGLPPLEAMQCGVPVITSNTSSLPEVVGDAGSMLDPQNLEGLCGAMLEVLRNTGLHAEMSRRALLQASQFSWNRCVEETIAAYKSALSEQTGKVGTSMEPTIVIDGVIFQLQFGRPFGISRLWCSLLTELAATPLSGRIVLLDREGTAPEISGIRRRKLPAFCLGNALNEAAALDQVCCEEQAGLFISTYYTFTTKKPSLLMLYDMIPERFDTVSPVAANPEWRDKYHAISNSMAFAAISQSTASDLNVFYPQTSQRPLMVIPCAVSSDFRMHSEEEIAAFKASSGIDRPYFLLVGRRDTHKNAALFFQAFARLPNRERYALVMAGGGNALEPELRALAGPAAGYAGFFSDQDLSLVYSGAIALVYPSLYEGFGLPILEAMQSGCPVITCQNSSLPEVAGSAALYVGEYNIEEMSKALLAIQQSDVRSYLIKRGLERTRHFSWRQSAGMMAEFIRKTISSAPMHAPGGF